VFAISNRTRIAQISLSLNGVFWPTSFPLFQGSRFSIADMTGSPQTPAIGAKQLRRPTRNLNSCYSAAPNTTTSGKYRPGTKGKHG
jgi:hypothetical protein